MTLVVLGIDALDPELVTPDEHPNLTLDHHTAIDTIVSSAGEPSTHELWPTIITGLPPDEHGLTMDDGVGWENPVLQFGSNVADYVLPDAVQTRVGAWILNNTDTDVFRTPATYYESRGLSTVFDGRKASTIGIPNYVTDPNTEDREHSLRQQMGDLFERDVTATGGHRSSDPREFYERCLEMVMVRVARTRRALRSREFELVFGYTSGLDLVGHVSYDLPGLQSRAYGEIDEFVAELRGDLGPDDSLLLVSDHGLQNGLHTEEAMVASTPGRVAEGIESVLDVREAIEEEIEVGNHEPGEAPELSTRSPEEAERVQEQLEDLGYM